MQASNYLVEKNLLRKDLSAEIFFFGKMQFQNVHNENIYSYFVKQFSNTIRIQGVQFYSKTYIARLSLN